MLKISIINVDLVLEKKMTCNAQIINCHGISKNEELYFVNSSFSESHC